MQPSLRPSQLIHDLAPAVVLNRSGLPRHYLYVDNCGIVEGSAGEASHAVDECSGAFAARGQPVHDLAVTKGPCENRGCELDFEKKRSRVAEGWYWRVRRCLDWLLRQRKAAGRML